MFVPIVLVFNDGIIWKGNRTLVVTLTAERAHSVQLAPSAMLLTVKYMVLSCVWGSGVGIAFLS